MVAKISEIFESQQGEGPYTGVRQVFVRFYGCNRTCGYCDTSPESFTEYDAPGLDREVQSFAKGFHSVSLTGGEPLTQADFLEEFLSQRKNPWKVYLETNGTLPRELAKIINHVDIVAMDLKLPSSTGELDCWQEHEKFLKVGRPKECFIKIVVTKETTEQDIGRARDLILAVRKDVLVVLQPAWGERNDPSLIRRMVTFEEDMIGSGLKVLILPQAHKMAGIR